MEDEDVSFEVRNLTRRDDVTVEQEDARLHLLSLLENDFIRSRPEAPGESHRKTYEQAVRMMQSVAVNAFSLDDEDDALRDAYGRNPFGQGCLLACRLLENDVSFVEVNLSDPAGNGGGGGWDTHADNFTTVGRLCRVLDPAWATLLKDLEDRGFLKETLVVWIGEFERTQKINDNSGRDHWPRSWSVVLGGAGIDGGQVYGNTAADGVAIEDNPVTVPELMATICHALSLDPAATNLSNVGRPIPLADHGAMPIDTLLR